MSAPLTAGLLVLPMFVREGLTEPRPIASLPGVVQHSLDSARRAAAEAAAAGLRGVMLFGVPERRDARGSGADDPAGILNVAARAVADEVGDAIDVQTDLCLDEFTDHGHCGVLGPDGEIDLVATLERYCSAGLAQAESGAATLGLSGMMPGQVGAVRSALDAAGHTRVRILAYSAKYRSPLYGPFRDAVESAYAGGPRSYQLPPDDRAAGVARALADEREGADVVMVKPAGQYLDVIAAIAERATAPVWAYQVSGEYAATAAAAERGWLDAGAVIDESLTAIVRAGATGVLTYWAMDVARRLTLAEGR